MRRALYFFGQATRGMRRTPLIQLACTGALAVSLLLVGLAGLGAFNVSRLAQHWGQGKQLVVYLEPETKKSRVDALYMLLARRQEVAHVRRITPKAAYGRLKESLGEKSELLSGVTASFLPTSLEVRLASGHTLRSVKPLIALLQAAPNVAEVEHLGRWAEQLGSLVDIVRHGALIIALIVALACLYIVATTIRLGVFARREEIHIQQLVGATGGFIRTPFLIEGALQGALAAGIAVFGLHLLYQWAAPPLQNALGVVLNQQQLAFLPLHYIGYGFVVAALLGVIGSGMALGRHLSV
jgi:cell division transport system permease protein